MQSAKDFIGLLRRQARWLSESRKWIITEHLEREERILTSLDVGCGPGFIMKDLFDTFKMESVGIDLDKRMVESARALDLDAVCANAHWLPFSDSSFDLVHCTFTLMWMEEPIRALREMKRVSKRWVVCFAEPDYGSRVDFPDSLSELPWMISDSIKKEGGDPYVGRKLRGYFSHAKMESKIGVFDSVWTLDQLESEFKDEWDFLERSSTIPEKIKTLRPLAKEAINAGIRMQYTPIFYAIARV